MKKTLRILLGRIGFCGLLIALQAIILIVVILRFQQYFVYFYALCILLSVLVVMVIVNSRLNPAYKIGWIIAIMAFPIFGGLFYLLFGSDQTRQKFLNEMLPIHKKKFRYRSLSIRTGYVWRNRAGLPELDAVSPDQAISRNTDERADTRDRVRTSVGTVPFQAGCTPCDYYQFHDGRPVRQSERLAYSRPDGCR